MRRNNLIYKIKRHPYYNYFIYLVRHKYWVAHMLFQRKMYVQGLLHDMSKFRPSEFKRYAKYFASSKQLDIKEQWLKHMHRNKHHWQYWVLIDNEGNMQALEMPEKYVIEMIADWYAVVICEQGFDRLPEEVYNWYFDRRDDIFMNKISKEFLEENIVIGLE